MLVRFAAQRGDPIPFPARRVAVCQQGCAWQSTVDPREVGAADPGRVVGGFPRMPAPRSATMVGAGRGTGVEGNDAAPAGNVEHLIRQAAASLADGFRRAYIARTRSRRRNPAATPQGDCNSAAYSSR
jgi:hypothetical protein